MEIRQRQSVEPDFADLRQEVGVVLRHAHVAIFQDLVRTFEPFGLRPAEFTALRILYGRTSVQQVDIGREMSLKVPNLVAMINTLAERGLVCKIRSESDRRSNGLALTSEGESLLLMAREAEREHARRIAERISPAEAPLLLDMLRRLALIDGREND